MKTDSNPTQKNVALLFSQTAANSGRYEVHEILTNDGKTHKFHTVSDTAKTLGRDPIIPFFHDAELVAEISPSDIASGTDTITKARTLLVVVPA